MTREDKIVAGMLLGFALMAWLTSGCGSGALRAHATTALVAMTAENAAEDLYLAHLDHSLAGCDGEAACLDATVASHAPAEAAIELVRVAVVAYADGVALAAAADESGDVMSALVAAALRLVRLWGDVVRVLGGLGIDVPALPVLGAS